MISIQCAVGAAAALVRSPGILPGHIAAGKSPYSTRARAECPGYGKRSVDLGPCLALLVLCLTATSAIAAAQPAPRQIGWADLTVRVEFEDPFEDLTPEQLMHLSIYARVTGMQEQVPEKVSDGMREEAEEAAATLKAEGVDIAGLLAKREEIKELRKHRASATNPKLDGKRLKMPGYALPLEYEGKKVKEFLLVPWVGACIHTPPPPPNQIVYVSLEQGFEVRSRFEPVWVTGKMEVGAATKNLYLIDGTSDISIGYSIKGASAERYTQLADKPVPRRGKAEHD